MPGYGVPVGLGERRAASSARSAERATCGRTGMARSGPAPGVTSSCRAAKAASSPRGARPTWDRERRRRTRGGRAQDRPPSRPGVAALVADSYELGCPGVAAKLRRHPARARALAHPDGRCRIAGSQRWQILSDPRPRPASIGAARRRARLHLALSGDRQSMPSNKAWPLRLAQEGRPAASRRLRAVNAVVNSTEELVHYLGALNQQRPKLPPVYDLRRPRAGVPGQPGDLLHGHARG
jgi:hypothetical protein